MEGRKGGIEKKIKFGKKEKEKRGVFKFGSVPSRDLFDGSRHSRNNRPSRHAAVQVPQATGSAHTPQLDGDHIGGPPAPMRAKTVGPGCREWGHHGRDNEYKVTGLTILPSPEPRSTIFPGRPLNSDSTFSTCRALAPT